MLDATDHRTARLLFSKTVDNYQDRAPKTMETIKTGFDDYNAVLILLEKHLKRLRTSNAMEWLIEEVRRGKE